ncbi:SAICAR synthase-like protein [Coemansia reversa NRRL 1564]|uniref:Kinase n=1 Tax=Coemansia reversa (strain ATCC 12441 / NRRL 1564) TaxID=763665 RepID=A0A2G5BIT9_COERN|nr:SAICAR synthase-like protein [Coemansia reversa NRRL 1564]|eukprot:PIA18923.1 SAICAR synthase-like protein [Coemansia reversa NRRL 1564]
MDVQNKSRANVETAQAFEYQVAGHPGVLVVEDNAMIIKPLNKREQEFYEGANGAPEFKSFMPVYYGMLQQSNDNVNSENAEFICLENLVHGFDKPCVLDIKIGSRLWDIDAAPEKQAAMVKKGQRTTSGKLGIAVTGMKLHGQPSEDREWCRDLTEVTILDALAYYFSAAEKSVSKEYRDYVIRQFILEITELLQVVERTELRMYSSSLLFVYDASKTRYEQVFSSTSNASSATNEDGNGDNDEDQSVAADCSLLDMKAIDFAHSHWTPDQGPDQNYISGIHGLLESLRSVLAK